MDGGAWTRSKHSIPNVAWVERKWPILLFLRRYGYAHVLLFEKKKALWTPRYCQHAGTTSPRALDLSGIQLTPHAAAALSDILTIEWGLRKLVLRECDLDELVCTISHIIDIASS